MLAPRPRIAALGAAARQRPRDVGVVFEVDERAREAARDFAPLFEAADTGAAGLKDIYGMGAAVALGIVCATPARAIGTAVEVERVQTT
jgi:hypothetical protein